MDWHNNKGRLSSHISNILDQQGYSREQILRRRNLVNSSYKSLQDEYLGRELLSNEGQRIEHLANKSNKEGCLTTGHHAAKPEVNKGLPIGHLVNENLNFIVCGSVSEGIVVEDGRNSFSDTNHLDVFGVVKNIIGTDDSEEFRDIQNISLLQIDRGPNISPGYAELTLVKLENGFLHDHIAQSVHVDVCQDQFLVSSQSFLMALRGGLQELRLIQPVEYAICDRLISFQCFCPTVFQKWSSRQRLDWPHKADIQKVTASEGILIPSGDQRSPDRHLEWRISYAKAEKILTMSLNPNSLKLYILLRMLFKNTTGLSSYMLKTLVFWITEKTPERCLSKEFLLSQVLRALHFLTICFKTGVLPHYMNSSWNILNTSKPHYKTQQTLTFIRQLKTEGGSMFFRIPNFSVSLVKFYKLPQPLKKCLNLWEETHSAENSSALNHEQRKKIDGNHWSKKSFQNNN